MIFAYTLNYMLENVLYMINARCLKLFPLIVPENTFWFTTWDWKETVSTTVEHHF